MRKKSTDTSKLYHCGLCEKVFTLKSNLSRHILNFHQNNSYTCDECEKKFHRKDSLIRHVRSHQRKKRFRKVPNSNPSNKCPICLIAFPSKHSLLHHSRAEHEPIINDGSRKEYFECSKCAMRVNNKKDIKRHIYTVHSFDSQNKSIKKVPSLRCAECGKDFRYRKTIMDHYIEEHKIELELKQLTFDTIDQFEKWKSSCYTMTNAWVTSVYDVKRFRCHRSGFYEDDCQKTNRKRRRHLKIAGSKKIQAMCPSEITLRQRLEGGSCFVTHQKTHLGHSVDDLDELKYIHLKADDKKNIVRLLKAGIPKETILRNMYCDYDPSDVNYQLIETLPRIDDSEYRLDGEELKMVLPKVSKRVRRLRQRHTAVQEYAEREQFIVERIDEDIWQVGLVGESQGIVEMYVVQKCENECSSDCCELLCKPCQRCFHDYLCSCQDYSAAQNMCFHVHALCLFLLNQNQAIVDDLVTLSGDSAVPDELTASESSRVSKPMPKTESDLDERNFKETAYEVLKNSSESMKHASSIETDIEEMNFEEIAHAAPEIPLKSPLEQSSSLPSDGHRVNLKIVHVTLQMPTESLDVDNGIQKMNFTMSAAPEIPSELTQSITCDIHCMDFEDIVRIVSEMP